MEGTPKEISQLEVVLQNLQGFKKILIPELDDRWRFITPGWHGSKFCHQVAQLKTGGLKVKKKSQLEVKQQNLPGFKRDITKGKI